MDAPIMDLLPLDTPPPATTGFDYSQLEDAAANQAKAVVERYRERQKAYVIDTGRDLLSVKERLEHGLFLEWVQAEMGMTPRSAQRAMNAAEVLGDKGDTVSYLPPTVLYELSAPSTPEPVRASVLRRIEAGETIRADVILDEVREAREAVKATAAAEREAARRAALSDEQRAEEDALASRGAKRRAAQDRKAERERLEQRERAEREEIEAMMVATRIVDQLGADEAAALFSQPSASLYQVIKQTGRLAQIRRAHAVKPTEIPAHAVSRTSPLSNFIRDPEAEAEARAVADRIRDGEVPEPIIAVVDPDRRGRFEVIAGHIVYRALVDVLGRQMVPVQVAPPLTSSAVSALARTDG